MNTAGFGGSWDTQEKVEAPSKAVGMNPCPTLRSSALVRPTPGRFLSRPPRTLGLNHFLLKTASGFFPPNQSLPLFTLAPQNWDFFGPGSSFLLRSGKKGREGGGRQAAEACPPWVICGSPVLGNGSGSYMCLLHICARSSFPVSIDICPQWGEKL